MQDQVLREMIEKGEHLLTDKICAIDVEYGGGRTIPRIAVTGFNEEVLYYSDFCLRYEDWIETKLTQNNESDSRANGLSRDFDPLMHYSTKEPVASAADTEPESIASAAAPKEDGGSQEEC